MATLPALDSSFVHSVLGSGLNSGPARPAIPFTVISTDSRKISRGCLFVALAGDRFDGHDFIPQALQQGAAGILCTKGKVPAGARETHPGAVFFEVESTLIAYRALASAWRKLFKIPLVCVAGSVGKTTTKELLSAVLRGRWPDLLKTEGSQNGFVGIPMTLLELRPSHGAAVIEVGIDEVGAMQEHLDLVQPTTSVLTAIGPEHLENLRDIPTVAQEEGFALSRVHAAGGSVAINLDDNWIVLHYESLTGSNRIGYTLGGYVPGPDVLQGRVDNGDLVVEGPRMAKGGDRFKLPLPGEHNARNLLSAIAVACLLGLSADEMRAGLQTFKGAAGRSELKELPRKTPVVCDYYNAQPASMEAGLRLLEEVASRGPARAVRWACLGDMLEMGPNEEKFHRELAGTITELKIENVLLFGPRMKWLADELKRRGFAGRMGHFETHDALAGELTRNLHPGEAILIKGSRGMKMEEVWKRLEAFAQAEWKA